MVCVLWNIFKNTEKLLQRKRAAADSTSSIATRDDQIMEWGASNIVSIFSLVICVRSQHSWNNIKVRKTDALTRTSHDIKLKTRVTRDWKIRKDTYSNNRQFNLLEIII